MAKIPFELRLGCFADPIEEQLNAQGLTLGEEAKHAQAKADAMSNLYIADILTEAEVTKARKRFCRLVAKAVKQLPEENHA